MNVLGTIGVILLLAFLVEALVEAMFGAWLAHVEKLQPYRAMILLYVAFIVGAAGAFVYGFDLVHTVSVWLNAPVVVHPFGIALTGLAIGRGSHFIHDLYKTFIAKPPLLEQ
jgi:hypothetical protein